MSMLRTCVRCARQDGNMEAGSLAPWLGVLIASSGAVAILAHVLQPPRRALILIFKPLTTVLILAVALLPGTFRSSGEARAIVLGLLFSLAGDIWLMQPERYFAQGLAAFLAAHLSYAFAFRSGF